MRRREFQNDDPAFFAEIAARCEVGYLALPAVDGFPRAVAVNFAAVDRTIYFHGARAGDKFDRITADGRVGFTMALPCSLIPSYWVAREGNACPATQLYRSVEVAGRCTLVAGVAEAARGLEAIMRKYQPEGGYRPLSVDDPRYEAVLRETGLYRIDATDWTGKVRLGQNASSERRRTLIDRLRERGEPLDLATAQAIEDAAPEDFPFPDG